MSRRPKWVARAEHAVDERTAPPAGERKFARGGAASRRDRRTLRREQQDEMARSWGGLGFLTDAQVKGGVTGLVAGAAVGALLLLPLGLVGWGGLALGWRLLIAALCGALAGAAAMMVYLGGRGPELEGETLDVDGPSVGTSPRDARNDERGRPATG
ncbi:MAG TPA: hypothetical protein VKZ72_09200 [Acidimicrobiales bacterium]|jgi:hypothetical protein|nr:hypothetical protein [Acidimicrobiales bacterium]